MMTLAERNELADRARPLADVVEPLVRAIIDPQAPPGAASGSQRATLATQVLRATTAAFRADVAQLADEPEPSAETWGLTVSLVAGRIEFEARG